MVASNVELRDKEVADALNKTGTYDVYAMVGLLQGAILIPGNHTYDINELDPEYKEDPNIVYFKWLYRDDKLAALPLNVNNDLLYYRKDLFDEVGLKRPDTWEDVIEAAKTLHDPDKPIYGFVPRCADDPFYEWYHMLVSFGGEVFVDWKGGDFTVRINDCLLYTSPSPRDLSTSRMPSSA